MKAIITFKKPADIEYDGIERVGFLVFLTKPGIPKYGERLSELVSIQLLRIEHLLHAVSHDLCIRDVNVPACKGFDGVARAVNERPVPAFLHKPTVEFFTRHRV